MRKLIRAVLWLSNCPPVRAISAWHIRADTAHLYTSMMGVELTLRDVLPGVAYAPFGPWTDAEQRATKIFAAPHVNSATQPSSPLTAPHSRSQFPEPVHPSDSSTSEAANLSTPSPEFGAREEGC